MQWRSIRVEHYVLCPKLARGVSGYQELIILLPQSGTVQRGSVCLGFRRVNHRREGTPTLEGHKTDGCAACVHQALHIVLNAEVYYGQGA